MKIFDIHTHAYPDAIAHKAVASLGEFYNFNLNAEGTVGELISMQKQGGSSGFLVFSVATSPDQVQKINNFLLSVKEKHSSPEMKIECFAAMHQEYADIPAEIERIISLGFKGVKLHPDIQKIDVDSPLLFPLYEYIEGRLPLYLHAGDSRYDYSAPEKIVKIKKRFKNLTIISAHLGGYQKWEKFTANYLDSDVLLDTSSTLWASNAKTARDIIRFHGAERVLFGTDYPIGTVAREYELLSRLELSESEYEMILYQNAAKLLNF